jgi:hypothetical protein
MEWREWFSSRLWESFRKPAKFPARPPVGAALLRPWSSSGLRRDREKEHAASHRVYLDTSPRNGCCGAT